VFDFVGEFFGMVFDVLFCGMLDTSWGTKGDKNFRTNSRNRRGRD